VSVEELRAYFEARRSDPDWRGCNVTMPLKEETFALVDVEPIARRIGAVNTVVRYDRVLIGTNTDWQGINLSLDTYRLDPKRVAIVGTGGAARAALEDMRQQRVPHVMLVTRSPGKAAALLDLFQLEGEALPLGAAPAADLLINASPLGMAGYPALELDLSRLEEGATVLDMVYHPLETPLLREARARGFKTVDGLSMLIHQASMAFTHFFKASPEPADNSDLRRLLTS
jgi:shikimate dehydrogenase